MNDYPDTIKYYPAMEEQKGFIRYFRYLPAQGHCLYARIDFDSDIDIGLMLRAFETGFSRLPYCCMRLHKQGKDILTYFSNEAPVIEPLADLRGHSGEKVQKYFEKLCKKGIPDAPYNTQLYLVYPAVLSGDKYSLLFVSSHLITDGYSQMYAVMYAFKTYEALKKGSPLPDAGMDPVPLMEKETKLFCSDVRRNDGLWWYREFETEPVFTSVNGVGSREFIKGKSYGKALSVFQSLNSSKLWYGKFSADLVSRIKEAAVQYGVPTQVYFMLALRSYLAYYCKTDDVMFYATVSRRGNIEKKKCGLMLANILPFRSIVPDNEKCSDALHRLKRIQYRTYRHTTTDLEVISDIYRKKFGLTSSHAYESVWFTYQQYYRLDDVNIKFHGYPISGELSFTPLYIYIMPTDLSGELTAEYFYCRKYVKLENVQRLHSFMVRFLDKAIQNPDSTIAELIASSIN